MNFREYLTEAKQSKFDKTKPIHVKIKSICKGWKKYDLEPEYLEDGTGNIRIYANSTTPLEMLDYIFKGHLMGDFNMDEKGWNGNKQKFKEFATTVKKISDREYIIEFR